MRDGNAGQVVEVLHGRRGPVGEEEHHCSGDCSCDNAKSQVACGGGDEGASEGEVPEVPDVDVEGLGQAGGQQNDVDEQCHRDDPQTDVRTKGDGGSGRPADINNVALNASAGNHSTCYTVNGAPHQANNKANTDEGDTNDHGGAECSARFCSQDDRKEEDDDREHYRGAQGVKQGFKAYKKRIHVLSSDSYS